MAKKIHQLIRNVYNFFPLLAKSTDEETPIGFWKGFSILRLQNSVFQTATQTGVSQELDLSLLDNLNELYSIQERYNEYAKITTQGLISNDFSDEINFERIPSFINMTMADL